MESPWVLLQLLPLLIFSCVFYKSKWLNEYNLNKPKFYLRYVDDILAAFGNEQDSLNILNFLNKRHPNIKFMIEKQINHSITFLDVFMSGINNQNLTFETYHKSTYTVLLLNPLCVKIIDKANSKFDLKVEEALHINWKKLKCTTKSFSSDPFNIACLCFIYFLFFYFFCCILRFSFIYYLHYF